VTMPDSAVAIHRQTFFMLVFPGMAALRTFCLAVAAKFIRQVNSEIAEIFH